MHELFSYMGFQRPRIFFPAEKNKLSLFSGAFSACKLILFLALDLILLQPLIIAPTLDHVLLQLFALLFSSS
jgi:hypothetical protein